jgi:4-amino-4-deoxy-L-arabinose transferase-like glycosyltransferase
MEGTTRDARWFASTLAVVAFTGLVVRVVYVLVERKDINFGGDAYFYHAGANLLTDGKGFISPFAYAGGHEIPAAEHPPLYLMFLAVPSLLGMTSVLTHLVWSCLLGTATIVIVGLLGRAVANARVGIVAAIVAVLYPGIWAPDGSLQAESVAMFTTALVLLLSYSFWRKPNWARLAAVGATCGAAALSRSELILLVSLVLVPLALLGRSVDLRQRLRFLAVGVLATVVVVAPWVGYNMVRFQHPVYLSSQFETLLAAANCDEVYYGPWTGYFSIPCAGAITARHHLSTHADQSQAAIVFRRGALDYIGHHKGRLPIVVAARVGRILGVFRPSQQLHIDEYLDRREVPVARATLSSFYVLSLLSVAGAIVLRRRRAVPLFPLLAVLGIVLLTAMVTYGNTRFRAPAEIVLAVLAAVAVDAGATALTDWRRRRRAGTEARVRHDAERDAELVPGHRKSTRPEYRSPEGAI